jgi:hypothetical protein
VGCGPPVYRMPGPMSSLGKLPEAREGRDRTGVVARSNRASSRLGERVAQVATSFVGRERMEVDGTCYRDDCSGLVEAAYAGAGLVVKGSVHDLYERAGSLGVLHKSHRPEAGDVAFFDDTWDYNRNGRFDDPLSHVAVVVSVDDKGTITLVHRGGGGVAKLLMNLEKPDLRDDDRGVRLNDYVRVKKRHDPAGARYLSGQLWVAFGSFWKADDKLVAELFAFPEPDGRAGTGHGLSRSGAGIHPAR